MCFLILRRHAQMQISAQAASLLNAAGRASVSAETLSLWRLLAHRLTFPKKMPPKGIFTICPAFLGRHLGHMGWGGVGAGRVPVSLTSPCAIFSTHQARKLHKSLASGHFQFSQKPNEWFPCIFQKGKPLPCSMNHYLENNRKESNPPLSGPKESGRAAF